MCTSYFLQDMKTVQNVRVRSNVITRNEEKDMSFRLSQDNQILNDQKVFASIKDNHDFVISNVSEDVHFLLCSYIDTAT